LGGRGGCGGGVRGGWGVNEGWRIGAGGGAGCAVPGRGGRVGGGGAGLDRVGWGWFAGVGGLEGCRWGGGLDRGGGWGLGVVGGLGGGGGVGGVAGRASGDPKYKSRREPEVAHPRQRGAPFKYVAALCVRPVVMLVGRPLAAQRGSRFRTQGQMDDAAQHKAMSARRGAWVLCRQRGRRLFCGTPARDVVRKDSRATGRV